MTRDELLIDPRLTILAENAAKRIARAEQLDVVSAKEVYRTVIEAMASACLAMESKQVADTILQRR